MICVIGTTGVLLIFSVIIGEGIVILNAGEIFPITQVDSGRTMANRDLIIKIANNYVDTEIIIPNRVE